MKRILVAMLAVLLLAVPVRAAAPYVQDDSDLLNEHEESFLAENFQQIEAQYGFTPIVVTVDSFVGNTAEEFAGGFYDAYSYGEDGMLLLVSLEEGEWYILTNGACAQRISRTAVEMLGEEVVELIRQQRYYEAFQCFAEGGAALMEVAEQEDFYLPEAEEVPQSEGAFGGTVLLCLVAGMAIGGIAVGIMAARMKSVRQNNSAADYVRAGSFSLTNSRDIYLYSTLHRTPKPKSNTSGGSHSGGSRGGAGGRI